jgi:hypothetical protein
MPVIGEERRNGDFKRREIMRILLYGLSVILLNVASAWSVSHTDLYVTPIKNDIAVFAHNPQSTGERPVFLVGTGDWLKVLESTGDMYRVSDMKGNIGWIGKTSVKQAASGETLTFGDAGVFAYLDNPTPVYILDASNPLDKSILLDRSFSEEIRDNVDRMTIERIVGESAGR